MDGREFGETLRAARVARALSQTDLATRLGTSERTVRALEAGNGSLALALAAMQQLGLTVAGVPDRGTERSRAPRLPGHSWVSPRREDRVGYELHREVVRRLRADPDRVVAAGLAGLPKVRRRIRGTAAETWLNRWEAALRSGPDAVERLALARSDEGSWLRQVSPFFGVIDETARRGAIARARHAA